MTAETPAAELCAAADKLRKLTESATPGRWEAEELPPNEHHKHPAHWVKTEYDDGDGYTTSQVVADCPWRQADVDYIAAMHPGIGAALADWLGAAADMAKAYPEMAHDHDRPACDDYACDLMSRAITLARQILA